MATFVFFYFAGVIVLTSLLVVTLRNPIYSALSLLIMFFHVAGLYVTLRAEFLAAVQIIVYAGAILVLYLFVVMLLNVKREEHYHQQFPIGAFLGLTILTEVLLLTYHRSYANEPVAALSPMSQTLSDSQSAATTITPVAGNTETIGEVLYSTYLFPFEVASLILLVAMIGAIILAKRDLFEQREG